MKKFLILFLFAIILSCGENDIGVEYSQSTPEGLVHWDILKVEGDSTVAINDTLILEVYCPRTTSCDNVYQLLPDQYGNRILMKAFGNTRTDSPCLMFALPQVIRFDFVPNKKGVFTFEFIKRDNSKIYHTIRSE